MGGRPSGLPAELLAQLGTKPDPQLARDFGKKVDTVAKARMARGIPAFNHQQKWTPEQVALLGTMTDREVAKRVGRNLDAVIFARRARKIPGCDHLGRPRLEVKRPRKLTAQEAGAAMHLAVDCAAVEQAYTKTRTSIDTIARRLHIPPCAVEHWAKVFGWPRCPDWKAIGQPRPCARCGGIERYSNNGCRACSDARNKAAYYAKHPTAVPRVDRTPEERRERKKARNRLWHQEQSAKRKARPQ